MAAEMTVDELYKIEQLIINNNQNGNLTPDRFNLINDQAQWDYMEFLLGDFRKYIPGRPIPPVAWGMTGRIRQSLTPFIQPATTLSVNPSTGEAAYPPNYEMWDAMYWGIYKQRVKFIQQGRLASHINSTINPVQRNPVFLSVYRGFEIYPNSIGSVQLSYIRSPRPIRWVGTNDIYGRLVYNQALSSNPEWQRTDMLEIIARAMRMMGVNLQANQVSQYAEQIKNQGQ
jgi:hypothetical protein